MDEKNGVYGGEENEMSESRVARELVSVARELTATAPERLYSLNRGQGILSFKVAIQNPSPVSTIEAVFKNEIRRLNKAVFVADEALVYNNLDSRQIGKGPYAFSEDGKLKVVGAVSIRYAPADERELIEILDGEGYKKDMSIIHLRKSM